MQLFLKWKMKVWMTLYHINISWIWSGPPICSKNYKLLCPCFCTEDLHVFISVQGCCVTMSFLGPTSNNFHVLVCSSCIAIRDSLSNGLLLLVQKLWFVGFMLYLHYLLKNTKDLKTSQYLIEFYWIILFEWLL